MPQKDKFYEERSILHIATLSLHKIKKLSESELISEKLLAFNIILFVFIAGLGITHFFTPSSSIFSLEFFIILIFSIIFSLVVSSGYGYILEIIANLTINKIESLRIGTIVLFVDLTIILAGLVFNSSTLINISLGGIGLQMVIIFFGALFTFSKEKIEDKKIEPNQLRLIFGDIATVITIVSFVIDIILIAIRFA